MRATIIALRACKNGAGRAGTVAKLCNGLAEYRSGGRMRDIKPEGAEDLVQCSWRANLG